MRRLGILAVACLISLSGCGRSAASAAIENCIRHYAKTRTEPNHFDAVYERSTHVTTVGWEGPVYPPLPTTELNYLGSGVASYDYRYRLDRGSWSVWQRTEGPWSPQFTIAPGGNNARITVEVKAKDLSGRTHRPVLAVVTAREPHWHASDLEAEDPAGECGEARMYPEPE